MFDDDILSAELEAFAPKTKIRPVSAEERRILTGFEDIERFVETHGRPPDVGGGRDIFERLYAVRLKALRRHPLATTLLADVDLFGLLDATKVWPSEDAPSLTDDELADALADFDAHGLTDLHHVRSNAERKEAEEIANREPCKDFAAFEPHFSAVQRELASGLRLTVPFEKDASIGLGEFFIVGGTLALVAEKGEEFEASYGRTDARLRVVYANKTESNLLMRSLMRALQRDPAGRRVTKSDDGPLFRGEWEEGDRASGTIYVLRSESDHPYVAEHRALIHKIGVTSGDVKKRIANAAKDATFLLADVKVVATYTLVDIQRKRLENILHRVFAPARLDLTIEDRFGQPVRPQEWFLVPFQAIEEGMDRIRDGSITDYVYDPSVAALVRSPPSDASGR